MAEGGKVGDLFMALALLVDDKTWALGQAVVDKLSSEMKTLAVNAQLASMDVKKAMGVIGLPSPAAKKEIKGLGSQIAGVATQMALAGAAYAGVRSVFSAVTEVVDAGGRLEDLSKQTGVSAESLQELGFAAKQSGSDMDTVVTGAKRLAKGLAEALKKGEGPVAEAFAKLGIPLAKMRATMSGPGGFDRALATISDRFAAMPDGPRKSALAMELFGKQGTELIPLLNEGSAGIGKLREEARKLGVVMSDEEVGKLAGFGDNIDKAKAAWDGLKQQAVIAVLPVLSQLMTDALGWFKANREMIAEKIVPILKDFGERLGAIAKVVWSVAKVWVALWPILKLPFIGMLLSIKLVTAIISKIGPLIERALGAIPELVSNIGRGIADFFSTLWDGITAAPAAIGRAFSSLWEAIKSGFSAAFDFVAGLPVIRHIGWLISKLDALTGLTDAVDLRSIQQGMQNAAPASAPSLFGGPPVRNSSNSATSSTTIGAINVTSNAADPVAVAQEVKKEIANAMAADRRDAAAALGA